MGDEGKLTDAYLSAENLWSVTENLLAKVESDNERGVQINPKSLALIYHYIFKIQSLLRDMNVAMVSSADSIPNCKLWQSRESLVNGDVSSLYLRLQKLFDHYQNPNQNPNPNPKVESSFDHPGLDVDDKCISSSFVGVNSSHRVIDTVEKGIEASALSDASSHRIRGDKLSQRKPKKQRVVSGGKESLPGYTWIEKALQDSTRPYAWWEIAFNWIALTLLCGVSLVQVAKIFSPILGI